MSVPVLSEQITEMPPRLSTACNLRTIAFSFAIFCVPSASTMVTIELKASGIAATAREIANIKASAGLAPFTILRVKIIPQIMSIITANFFPN